MLRIDPIAKVKAVAAKADLRLIGIGQMDQKAQVHVDGFVTREELFEMMRLGAVGEITGWAYRRQGPHHQGRHQPPADQHSAAGAGADDDHRRRRRAGQGSGHQGSARRDV